MNIPVIPVGDVTQGLPTGAIQSATPGTLAGALSEDFAITFGATLRQSEQQGNALLRKDDARQVTGEESGKLVPARTSQAPVRGATGLGTTDIGAMKEPSSILSLAAAGPKTDSVKVAIDSQTSVGSETVARDSVQSATARVDDKGALLNAEHEAPNVLGADKAVIGSSAKNAVTAKPEGLAVSNKTTAQAKTSATLKSFLKEPISLPALKEAITSTAPLKGSSDSDAEGMALANAAAHATGILSAGLKDELAVMLPNNLATASDLRDELTAVIKVSQKVKSNPAALAGTSVTTHPVAANTAIVPGTGAKLEGVKTAVKAEQASTASGLPDMATAQAAPAIAAIPFVVTPTAKTVETIPLSPGGIKVVGPSPGRTTQDFDPANPDAPVIAEMSAGKLSGTSLVTSKDSGDKAIVAKGDTDFSATEHIEAPVVSKSHDGAVAFTPTSYSNPLPASAVAAVSAPAVDITVKTLQQATPNSTFAVTTATTTAPGQGTFHLDLKTPTQATGTEAARADSESDSVQQSSAAATTLDRTAAPKPIEESAVAAVTEVAKATNEKSILQEPLERVKLSSVNSTSQQPARSEIFGAGSTAAPVATPVAGAHASDHFSDHASDHAASIAAVITTNAAPVNSAVSGLQSAAPATIAIAPTHSAATATGGTPASGVSAMEAGRISATAAPSTAEPYKTIVATPTALEVGVPNGTQGWLRIRAEVGDQGGINASLAAGSNASQEMLHRQLPALNDYLHSEQISVTTSVTDRVFAAAAGSLAGMATGSNGAGSDASGRSMNQDATANQGPATQSAMTMNTGNQDGGTQGNGSRHDVAQAFETLAIDDSTRNYDNRIGASDAVGAQTTRDGESGRWLNVRA